MSGLRIQHSKAAKVTCYLLLRRRSIYIAVEGSYPREFARLRIKIENHNPLVENHLESTPPTERQSSTQSLPESHVHRSLPFLGITPVGPPAE